MSSSIARKVVCITQPRYLPASTWIRRLWKCDEFILLDRAKFNKRERENRNVILLCGKTHLLTVPMICERQEVPLYRARISYDHDWAPRHVETIRHAYCKAPFFDEVFATIAPVLMNRPETLLELATALIEEYEDGDSAAIRMSSATPIPDGVVGEEMLIELCKAVGATHYLSGPGGLAYMTPQSWEKAGLAVIVDDTPEVEYPQLCTSSFVPYVAFYDMMFNLGIAEGMRRLKA